MAPQPDADPLPTTFELNDTLYAKAKVPYTDEVYLWLGANVMLAYPVAEAETLLEGKLAAATQSMENCEEDLDFLREQITVCAECVFLSSSLTRMLHRLSKWLLLESTTGMLHRRERRKPTAVVVLELARTQRTTMRTTRTGDSDSRWRMRAD